MPVPERASYQKGRLLTFILIADIPLRSSMIEIRKQRCPISTGAPIKKGQVNDLLPAISSPSEIAVFKIEHHTKKTAPDQGDALAESHER